MPTSNEDASIDSVRLQYRAQALQAVEDAEKRCRLTFEEEIKKWKAIAHAFNAAPPSSTSTDDGNNKNKLLIKYIMEQVYRDCKKEWKDCNDDTTADIINRMKTVLISSTDTLTQKMPKIYIHSDYNATTANVSTTTTTTTTAAAAAAAVTASVGRNGGNPCHVDITNKAVAFNYFPRLNITQSVNRQVKGYVVNGEITYYTIQSFIYLMDSTTHEYTTQPITYQQDRRYSEFQQLYQQLCKMYPSVIIPSLPVIDDIDKKASSKKSVALVARRQRQLSMWLQYIALHGDIQRSDDLIKFIHSGLNKKLLNIYYNKSSSSSSSSSSDYAAIDKQECKREVCRVYNDMTNVSFISNKVIKSCKELARNYVESVREVEAFGNAITSVGNFDKSFCKERMCWLIAGKAIDDTYANYLRITQLLQTNLYETLTFFGSTCLSAAGNACTEAKKYIVSNSSSSSSSSSVSDTNKAKVAHNIIAEWSTYSHISNCTIYEQLLIAATDMAKQYRMISDRWMAADGELKRLLNGDNDTMATTADSSDEIKQLVHESIAELEGYFKSTDRVIDGTGADRQSVKHKHSSGWSSLLPDLKHTTILSRPKLPAGMRRDPSRCAPTIATATATAAYTALSTGASNDHNKPSGTKAATVMDTATGGGGDDDDDSDGDGDGCRGDGDGHSSEYSSKDAAAAADSKKHKHWKNYIYRKGSSSAGLNGVSSSCDDTDDYNDHSEVHDSTAATGLAHDDDNDSDEDEDTPMNRAYNKRSHELLRAKMEEEQRHVDMSEEVFDRKKNRRAKLQSSQSSQHHQQQRRPKAKAPSNVPDVFVSAVKPADAVTGVAYKSSSDSAGSSSGYFTAPNPILTTSNSSCSSSSSSSSGSSSSSSSSNAPIDLPNIPTVAATKKDSYTGSNPLPVDWEEVVGVNGEVYYYHTVTRVSRWDRPDDKIAAAIDARVQESKHQVNESLRKHKENRENERKLSDQLSQEADKLKVTIQNKMNTWKNSASKNSIVGLLNTLHHVMSFIKHDMVCATPLSATTSTSSDIKKAYMKAVRIIHPDKLPSDITVEQKLIAQAAFIILTEAYDKERSVTAPWG